MDILPPAAALLGLIAGAGLGYAFAKGGRLPRGWASRGLGSVKRRVWGSAFADDHDRAETELREEIAAAVTEGHSRGTVERATRDQLLGALDLSQRTVDEVMLHRRQIEMINLDQPVPAILAQMLASSHTRMPLYRDTDDNILGVLHAKDLLREVHRLVRNSTLSREDALAGLDIARLAKKPYFVPETTPLDEQLRQFLKRRAHFALVVDEYGMLQGLITLEDILEEIVGDITDEFDIVSRDQGIHRQSDGSYLVEGSTTIRDLNRALDWHLPDTEANTIAGLVIHEAHIIPVEGQIFNFHGFRFTVLSRRENRIARLAIRKL